MPDAVPPIHAVSSHVATDKGQSIDGGKFRFGKTTAAVLEFDFRFLFWRMCILIRVSFYNCLPNYNEISGGYIWRDLVRRRCSAGPVLPLWYWPITIYCLRVTTTRYGASSFSL